MCTLLILASFRLLGAQKSEPKSTSSSRRWQLVKYFGASTAATYGFLYVTTRAAQGPHSSNQLLTYSLGLPTLLGLGIYLGVLTRTKPFDALIT
jgi:hypothetical protein